ncbi:LacI family DNA-binding transcriptional regulator [Subtercola boreus]|uniref:LacI family transcriptional regulator n=1 Tax=Subtercola boreus TaxID=120213 RepID=A0A3E0W6Y8_9MICO|nr:LacI family DNA-binding transcriptional regulator [Subtercola boreus]RFA18231.1 LacI family transcriptional regulator [Subtercola boreus]RFA18623.1 LacI family transcriptional regulator [Subtercola boreus]RFA25227.1 LacI family transcriptional regulator [Subtercola boreus]
MARSARGAATMQDVAALAGVSVKTVSNVLSGYEHVSAKMRERVMGAVGELDYEINVSARNLRVGSTRVLGLAVPELSQAYFAELADAVIRAAGARGYTVLIEQTIVDRSLEISAVAAMRRHSIDGLIYSPLAIGPGDVEQLDVDFPLVVLGERVEGSRADHVTMSNVQAMKAATLHVLSLGRRRVAVIGAQPDGPVGTAASRLRGYTEALADYGIEQDPDLIITAALWHRTYGVEAMERLLASGVPFDAVVCFNDALALGALRALHKHGRRIPEDVAVVGFDDIEDSAYSTPSLTTVSPRRDEIAQKAIDILIDRIEGPDTRLAPLHVETGYELIERESSAGVRVEREAAGISS